MAMLTSVYSSPPLPPLLAKDNAENLMKRGYVWEMANAFFLF